MCRWILQESFRIFLHMRHISTIPQFVNALHPLNCFLLYVCNYQKLVPVLWLSKFHLVWLYCIFCFSLFYFLQAIGSCFRLFSLIVALLFCAINRYNSDQIGESINWHFNCLWSAKNHFYYGKHYLLLYCLYTL